MLHIKQIFSEITSGSCLQYLISSQKPPVSCNDPISVDFLNHNVDERRLISPDDADAQLNIWVGPVNLYGSYLSFRKGGQLHTA